ncbi:Uncharacterized membrane protein YcaP, DUF421 family [Gracilibacillus ureilyticus]|uniref:Uncharacterized membrane protein YcaP, DUF421 family n=1 Tax=Gracilibacillus ureilyticus TaxID=531814 RepID=A0A1H9MS05_9BACI|nr:DUF421 domain-containing protein [Gracilibacillus ureilyticus]SER26494.1 Uncharacterized membrane protein YcaP, DUF421 family [Gracilibacillus ureilyticus]
MLQDLLLVIGRIVTILPIMLMITLFMGKRAIGELPVFDFLIIITLASVVGADIADPNIHHLPTLVAIIAIGILQKAVSYLKLANRKFGHKITLEPTVVIHEGMLIQQNIKKIGFSIDNILQMLREKDVFDIRDVETAIIEANGSLSVLKKQKKREVTLGDLQIAGAKSLISYPVIVEGSIDSSVLEAWQLEEAWLTEQLHRKNLQLEDVFFASVNSVHELHICSYEEIPEKLPPVYH